jgi:uncharacterized membrane protein YheB (UPF0754 family)
VSEEWQQQLPDFVRRLEEALFIEAASQEEYMNLSTLEPRLQSVMQGLMHDGSSVSSQTSTLGGIRRSWHTDTELYAVRKYIIEKILQLFNRHPVSPDWQQQLPNFVRRLEEVLFNEAASQEEYMNLNNLEQRLQSLMRRLTPNGNSVSSQTSNPGGVQRSWRTEADLYAVRQYIIEKILQVFHRQPISSDWQQRLPNFVRFVEEGLFNEAASKEEYMNLNTLEPRMQSLVRRIRPVTPD